MAEPLRMKVSTPLPSITRESYDSEDSNTPDYTDTVVDAPFENIYGAGEVPTEAPKSTQDLEREAFVPTPEYTKTESFKAGVGGFARRGMQVVEAWQEELDPNFNPTPYIEDVAAKLGGFTPQENLHLASARNARDYGTKLNNILDKRKRAEIGAANELSNIAGSIVDVDIVLGALGKAARVTSLGQRAAAGAVAAGATTAFYQAAGDESLSTPIEQFMDATVNSLVIATAPRTKYKDVPETPNLELEAATATRDTALAAATKQHAEAVQAATRNADEVATQAAQSAKQAAAKRQVEYEAALKAATKAGLSDADIAKAQPQVRGDLRQARARYREEQVAAVQANKPADVLPTAPSTEATQAAIKALDDELAKTQEAIELEFQGATKPVPTERATQELLDELSAPRPTGTPSEQIKKVKWYSRFQSTSDRMDYYAQNLPDDHIVKRLYSSPAKQDGYDVPSTQNVFQYDYDYRLSGFSDAMYDAVTARGVSGMNPINRQNGKFGRMTREVSSDFQVALQRADAEVTAFWSRTGTMPSKEALDEVLKRNAGSPEIYKVMRSYVDSGFAVKTYDDMVASGKYITEELDELGNTVKVDAMENVVRRDTYMPLHHDYDKLHELVYVKKAFTIDEAANFIGAQIARMYPDLLKAKNAAGNFFLTESQLGKHYIATQKANARKLSDVSVSGMTMEDLATILTRTGAMGNKEALRIADEMYSAMHKAGTGLPKHMRKRMEWDWNLQFKSETGYNITMRDFVNDNVMHNLEDYSRNVAHTNGLALHGIKSEAELDKALGEVLDDLPKGIDPQEAKQFLENSKNSVLGKPIAGAALPTGLRAVQAVAGLWALVNGGLLSLMELATQTQKVGLLRSLPAIRQGLRASLSTMKKFNKENAKTMEDIFTGKLMAQTQWRNFFTRTSDNFAITSGNLDTAEYLGQATRFVNMSETVRRFQSGILASIYVDALKGAMAGSKSHMRYLTNQLKLSDTLIKGIEREYAKHGTNIDAWGSGVRIPFERQVFHDADNLALKINRGEVPALLEHTAAGQIILPYMSFSFSAQNKVMRRTHRRDGNTGFALMMAVQLPTAVMIGAAINIRRGKDIDEDLAIVAFRALSGLGSMNFFAEMAYVGLGEQGGSTAFVPPTRTYDMLKGIASGEDYSFSDAIGDSPLNSNLALRLTTNIFTPDKE